MSKTKICRGCYLAFIGRKGAKTCSARCRKRVQRTRELLTREIASGLPTKGATSKQLVRSARTGLLGLSVLLYSLLFSSALTVHGLALSQGYSTRDPTLKSGMAVSLSRDSDGSHSFVQSADFSRVDETIGIASGLDEDLLTEAPVGSQIYVTKSGIVKAYVSDLNGLVKKGDLVTLSTLRGILMRASDRSVTIIGTALKDFSISSAQSVKAKDASGGTVTANVSLLDINVDIHPPDVATVAENSNNVLDKLSLSLTGHKINGLRVLAALAVFSTLLVIEGEIIYGTITSSIIALGRNPLARRLIGWQSLRSASVGILILMVGTAAIALLLWV